jgi:hypothetical protein
VLVLFAILFTVILVIAGFAIDQGFWYGERRVVQKDADLAARAGALAYMTSLTNTSGAEAAARDAAVANGASPGDLTVLSHALSCTTPDGTVSGAPQVEVRIEKTTRGLFTSLPLVSDDTDGIEIGARSVACAGGVRTLEVDNSNNPSSSQNTLKAIPIVLRSDAGGPGSCFSGGALRLGQECVIWGALRGYPESRRIGYSDPGSGGNDCRGSGNPDLHDDTEDGIDFTCTVTTGSSCDDDVCVRIETVDNDDEGEQEDLFQGMNHRLEDDTDCDSIEGGDTNEASFQNAFGNADGDPSIAPDPPALGGSGTANHVWVQNDCFDNPRIVVLPIITGGSNGSGSRPVRGFAVVYLTGCYETGDTSSISQREREECEDNGGDEHEPEDCDDPDDANDACFVEVRGIPVRVFASRESIGDIASPSVNSLLTIQTVQ